MPISKNGFAVDFFGKDARLLRCIQEKIIADEHDGSSSDNLFLTGNDGTADREKSVKRDVISV